MKIRTGFVSNSSSSSFLLIVKKELHDKLKKELHPFIIAVMEKCGDKIVNGVFGEEALCFSHMSGPDGDLTFEYIELDYDGEIPESLESWNENEKMEYYEAFEVYEKSVKKYPNEFFSHLSSY